MFRLGSLSLLVLLCHSVSFAQEKKALALGELSWQASLSGNGFEYTKGQALNMLDSLRTMVTTALTQSRKFEVVERAQLSQIVTELGLIHDSGLVDPDAISKTPEWGRLSGIHWLVLGAITQFSIDQSGFAASGVGGYAKETMLLEVDLRIVDVESGRLIDAVPLRTKVNLGGGIATQQTKVVKAKQSAGQKMSVLLRSCANQMVHRIVANTLPIRILDANKGEVVLNYGKGLLREKDVLVVFRPGESYVDPDTGNSEAELVEIGRLEVFQTQNVISKAKAIGKGSRNLNQGDICQLSEETETARSGPFAKFRKLNPFKRD